MGIVMKLLSGLQILALALALGAGCHKGSELAQVKALWGQVTSAKTSSEEERAIEELRLALRDSRAVQSGFVRTRSGKELAHADYTGDEPIESVRFVFQTDEGEFKTGIWRPKDAEHYHHFFRE